jgi:hypothetical protein
MAQDLLSTALNTLEGLPRNLELFLNLFFWGGGGGGAGGMWAF